MAGFSDANKEVLLLSNVELYSSTTFHQFGFSDTGKFKTSNTSARNESHFFVLIE